MCAHRPESPGLHCKKRGLLKLIFLLDRRKKFFAMRVMMQWSRLSREAVDAPFLEVFKARLDGALSNLV